MMEKMITSLSDKLGQEKCRMAMIPFYGQLAVCRPSFVVPLSGGSQMPIKIHSMSVFYLSIWALFDCWPVESCGPSQPGIAHIAKSFANGLFALPKIAIPLIAIG